MSRISRPLALVVMLLATTGTHAWARDVCFTLPGLAGSVNFVAKSFAVPGRNKCRAITGFSSIQGWVLSGTACTTADGALVRLAVAGHGLIPATNPFQIACTIPLPAMTGGTCAGSFTSVSSVSDEAIPVTSTVDLTSCVVNVP
ncbi:MAG TPA: hypothetical protein VGR62_01760 [Candidatus Binatia bacterium]|jgi:hypothetical protein|nr:hypothetical protein [Candidatus Binatia bacterium]